MELLALVAFLILISYKAISYELDAGRVILIGRLLSYSSSYTFLCSRRCSSTPSNYYYYYYCYKYYLC